MLILEATIFHPQGGGQPSDEGTITSTSGTATFTVSSARTDAVNAGIVLHFGHFDKAEDIETVKAGDEVQLKIDAEKRLLYSRLHTAGHVLGAAVRHLLQDRIPGFDELKASHMPGQASCEFAGSILGTEKDGIQAKVLEYVEADMPVEIEFWDEDDFKKEGLERLIPDRQAMGMEEGEKFRVVRIKGAECYPCGGTHVKSSKECGDVVVKKISRSKGTSRISYAVDGE